MDRIKTRHLVFAALLVLALLAWQWLKPTDEEDLKRRMEYRHSKQGHGADTKILSVEHEKGNIFHVTMQERTSSNGWETKVYKVVYDGNHYDVIGLAESVKTTATRP